MKTIARLIPATVGGILLSASLFALPASAQTYTNPTYNPYYYTAPAGNVATYNNPYYLNNNTSPYGCNRFTPGCMTKAWNYGSLPAYNMAGGDVYNYNNYGGYRYYPGSMYYNSYPYTNYYYNNYPGYSYYYNYGYQYSY